MSARVRLLVTGAGGMLGHDVMSAAGDAAVGLTPADLDVTHAAAVERALLEIRPHAVINCAAYTDVDGAESDETAATLVNGDGAGNVATAADEVDAFVGQPSTDYGCDGKKREPYVETDPTSPRTAYGRSKLAGEWTVAEGNPRHAIVRTAWLFGLHGQNFVDTMLNLDGPLKVVDDQIGCPTYTGHLAEALLDLAESRRHTGVVHVAGGGECSWYEFALEIFRQGERDGDGAPCTTEE